MDRWDEAHTQRNALLAYREADPSGVWVAVDTDPAILASPGSQSNAAEKRILDIVRSAVDRSALSTELRGQVHDLASAYHLSSLRANLLRPFEELLKGAVILEVGAGCGALTRYMGEVAAGVIALERSYARAEIAAARCSDLEAVKVVCDGFMDSRLGLQFDVITLIGALEHEAQDCEGGDPAPKWLSRAFELLRPGGRIILASENQNGLKHLCGAYRDDVRFQGAEISSRSRIGKDRTYGRLALEQMIGRAGFTSVNVYVPLPDHRLPTSLIEFSQEVSEPLASLNSALFQQAVWHDRSGPASELVPLASLWYGVARNGLGSDLANSFLFLGRKPGGNAAGKSKQKRPRVVAWHYSTDRRPIFCKEACFELAANGIRVRRRALSPGDDPVGAAFRLRLEDEQFVVGQHWGHRLEQQLQVPGWCAEDVAIWVRTWLHALSREIRNNDAPQAKDQANADKSLLLQPFASGSFVDFLPHNLIIRPDGEAVFIDKEWVYNGFIETAYLIFRAIFVPLGRITAVAKPSDPKNLYVLELIKETFKALGLSISDEQLDRYLTLEGRFQSEATGRWVRLAREEIGEKKLPVLFDLPELKRELYERQEQLNMELKRVSELGGDLAELQRQATASRKEAQIQEEYLAELEGMLGGSGPVTTGHEGGRDDLQGGLSQRRVAITAMLREREERLTRLAARLDEEKARTRELSSRLERSAEVTSKLDSRVQQLEPRVTQLTARLDAERGRASELMSQSARNTREASKLTTALQQREASLRQLTAQLEREKARASRLVLTLSEREADLKDVLDSASWLLTAPIRRLGQTSPPLARAGQRLLRATQRASGPNLLQRLGVHTTGRVMAWRYRRALTRSGLFDARWYLSRNPDVAALGADPLVHYLKCGGFEGRDPSPRFDSDWYLAQNADVREAKLNPLVHFLLHGAFEGRAPKASQRLLSVKPGLPRQQNAEQTKAKVNPRYLVFSHNLSDSEGAPHSLKELCLGLKSKGSISPILASPADGSLRGKYEESGIPVVVSPELRSPLQNSRTEITQLASTVQRLAATYSIDGILANTALGFHMVYAAHRIGRPAVWIIRESEDPRESFLSNLTPEHRAVFHSALDQADRVVFVSRHTRDKWLASTNLDEQKTVVIHNGLDFTRFEADRGKDRAAIRRSLAIQPDEVMLLCVGTICQRKNQVQLVDALELLPQSVLSKIRVVCVGARVHSTYLSDIEARIEKNDNLRECMLLLPETPGVGRFYRAADAFVLPSLLESFPRVVLEAMHFSLPIIANPVFGVREQTREGVNALYYDAADASTLAARFAEILDPALRKSLSLGSDKMAAEMLTFDGMLESYTRLLRSTISTPVPAAKSGSHPASAGAAKQATGSKALEPPPSALKVAEASPAVASIECVSHSQTTSTGAPGRFAPDVVPGQELKVTVVVPNCNYSHFLEERLGSIIQQTVSPFEILFLDDASSDDSVAVAKPILEMSRLPFRIVENEGRAGTYSQWLKGIALAKGDIVWIAEADDACDPDFLRELLARMRDSTVVLAYCQSRKIDENGRMIARDNLAHTQEIDPEKWRRDYVELGLREVVDCLSLRNTIPNVSACIFRKQAALGVESELANFRSCGDWLFYAHLLRNGKISYVAKPMNAFRRHSTSITRTSGRRDAYLAELAKVHTYISTNFPINHRQIPRIKQFLDRDYKVEGITRNTEYPAINALFETLAADTQRTKRLVFVTCNNGSHTGGSEVLWKEAALRARAMGHDVVALIKWWEPRPAFFDALEACGIRIYGRGKDDCRQIAAFDPDLVVISIGDQDEGLEYYRALKGAGIPYVIVNQLTKEVKYWPIKKSINEEVRSGYSSAKRVFFTCENNHRVMEARLGCRLDNAARHYNPPTVERSLWLPFPSTADELRLAVPARLLCIHKGQDLLLDVLKADKWRARKIVVNLYGDGPDKARLVSGIEQLGLDNLRFHAPLADVRRIWESNHGILMPSRMEGVPIVLMDAMIARRVPIVTDIGGHGELISDGVNGFLASSPSAQAFDDALERAYQRRDEWEEIGRRARAAIDKWLPRHPVQDFVDKVLSEAEQRIPPATRV